MNNIEKTKAYSYVRMSTDIQLKGDSLRRQKESSKNYAEENNLELIETLQDIGISAFSGKNSKDGALGVFLEAIESNKIEAGSYLLVESLDRLSRESVLTAFNQFTSILQQHITIVTLTDNQVYTKESVNNNIGQLFTSLGIMLRANEESKTKSIRLKAAWLNKRNSLSTKKYTGISPAWLIYDKVLDEFKINDGIAKAVKQIFKMSINGYGTYSITSFLNTHPEEFPPYRSKNGWHKSYVQKLLNNQAVYGEFQAHKMDEGKRVPVGNVTENYFPSIISKEDFYLSQLRLKQRTINGSGRKG
jgi:DNA invertase Pin-like site-specific DNA recombinase